MGLFKVDFLKNVDVEKTDPATVELLKSLQTEVEEAGNKALEGMVSMKAFNEKLEEALKTLATSEELKAVKEDLSGVGEKLLKLKAATERGDDGQLQVKSWKKQIEEQLKDYITTDKKGNKSIDLREACKTAPGNKRTLELILDTKAVATITSGSTAPHLGLQVDPDLSVSPRARTIIREVANVSPITSRSLVYAEYQSKEGDAKWVAEGALKPNMDAKLVEHTVTAGKVAITAKFTEETITDLPQFFNEVQAEMINKLGLVEEQGILSGTGSDGQIKGVSSDMPGFSLTLTDKISKANMFDAIVAAYTQIISTSNMAYRPNAILINPLDYMRMQLEKDVNGQYLRPFRVGDELIEGLRAIQTTAVKVGDVWIGDWNYLNIRDLQGLTITIGWENDDFTKNLITVIAEKRLMAYIKAQYKTAFVKDTFENIIEGIVKEDAVDAGGGVGG